MEYYFNQLEPIKFQRLINAILIARFGEDARLTPLRGKDGGRDGETAPGSPYFEFQVSETMSMPQDIVQPPRKGRYLFQVKHHRTTDKRLSDARQAVIADFAKELKNNVLKREGAERVNYFFLITNVPSSGDALEKVDKVRNDLLRDVQNLHADVWWQERVVTHLDQMPSVWNSFPEIFAGNVIPVLARVVDQTSEGLPRAIRLAVDHQYEQDKNVKFRQIELEQSLSKLFVDLDVDTRDLPAKRQHRLNAAELRRYQRLADEESDVSKSDLVAQALRQRGPRSMSLVSALGVLLDDDRDTSIRKLILEGGPGQGKSTIAQMAVQIYRQQILGRSDIDPEKRWLPPQKFRLPFRIELRRLAEFLSSNLHSSVEEYLALRIKQDSGGNEISVGDIHAAVEKSPVFLAFDGLDEIGSDQLRDDVLKAIIDCIQRLERVLQTDLRVVITTRPPALAGRRDTLIDFEWLPLAPMARRRIKEYVARWLSVQIRGHEDRERISESFERRQDEPHVQALARNPMQLSVLLQLIRLKGEAFPDQRAELYKEYFQIVIDRDVEKSPELRKNREVIEALHGFLGYRIHALTEVEQADRTLDRGQLISMVEKWLGFQGHDPKMAKRFFRLGEERFGLIVASRGAGEETRYGYEVQPIQEYFAAAFISNQIQPSSAHDVFEAMLHRPYWREVALFLAGLRRPNEKADLVARARRVDQDKKLGWYQDGRATVLQLLQEGVFSEPPYVFSQALDFILDLLDVRRLKVQREPPSLLGTLEALVSRNSLEPHQERIVQLLQDYNTEDDQYVMRRLYHVARGVLQSEEYATAVLSYKGDRPDLLASVRLGWPYALEADMDSIIRSPSFWQGVPDSTWAETWWNAALHRGMALDLPVPVRVHQYLVEHFATKPMGAVFVTYARRPLIETLSKLAVWRMVRCQQMLQTLIASGRFAESAREKTREQIASVCETDFDIDYAGLEEPVRSIVSDIIRLTEGLVMSLCNGNVKESCAFTDYIEGIGGYLQYPGLASWIACRCAVNVIQAALLFGGALHFGSKPSQRMIAKEDLLSLADHIRPFYEGTTANRSGDSKRESATLDFLVNTLAPRPVLHGFPGGDIPRYVRSEPGGKLVALVDLLAESVRSGGDLPFEWMRTMPLPRQIIRPLVEKNRDCLPDVLASLSEHQFSLFREGPALRVQDTQRILKIARNTDDPKVLAGVATTLLSASFLRIARPPLILKLLRFDSKESLGPVLFGIYNREFEDRDPDSLSKETTTVEEVARGVLDMPDAYPFWNVCQAANFLAERSPIELPPLLAEEEKLGIRPCPSWHTK